ncbi:phage tail protein [Pedobacter xixiisoli]|uniref:Microcystin-dependent protein n=1 Tax=Pedobacter xixiisoli TaxID=1476464 RepID=A0A285ZUP0_9SPHI|nr:tail fiber protein [Pedobacter xixiisoli]SOD13371.1 Microcystin-dependent protein [Pedobacter xixiisoli]
MDGYVGEIRLFAATFAPRNWAFCWGQVVAIRSNTALFSIIGTYYGGNGTTTFQLPNFAGRTAIGQGGGPGLSTYIIGETGGTSTETLVQAQMPAHTHNNTVSAPASGTNLLVSAADSTLAVATAGSVISTPGYTVATGLAKTLGFNNATPNTVLHTDSIKVNNTSLTFDTAGGSIPHNNMQPSLGMNYIICMYGVFPARN